MKVRIAQLAAIVSVVNATGAEQKFDLRVTDSPFKGTPALSQLTESSLDAIKLAGKSPELAVKKISADSASGFITLAPISVGIYRFPLAP